MYEYKFDKMKPEGKSYPSAERVMHYYENQSNRSMWKWNGIKPDDQNEDQQSIQKIRN